MKILGWFGKKWLLSLATLLMAQQSFAVISNFVASSDVTNVSYSFNYTGTPQFIRMFIDADRNAATGFRTNTIGADYLIENGDLYRYSGSNGSWGWSFLRSSNMQKTTTSVRWTVARASIGSPSSLIYVVNDGSSVVGPAVHNLSAPTVTTTTLQPAVIWTRCATEGGTCTFTGTRQVRYGVNGIYAYRTATGSISCTNGVFGDPVVGTQKFCDYSSVVQSAPVTTTTTLRPTVTTLPPPPPTTTLPPPPTTTTLPLPPPSGSTAQVNYSASSAQIANPERGFYHDINCVGGAMDVNQLRNYRINEGITLIHCYNQINSFLNSPLSSSVLSLFDSNLAVMRNAGMKTVIRFVYSMTDNGADPTLSMINTHMDQLAPYFAKNKDVIATIQVGFIGSWGEWANSQHFGQIQALSSQNMADRKALTDKLLSVVPVDRTVQIRFPRQKVSFYGSTALSATEAFTGTARARVGHHNDCFLTTSSDWGTYGNTSVEYPYLAEETKYTPMGGETCSYMAPRSDCTTALKELSMFHWSYLNLDYNVTVLNAWRSQGCFETVKSKLGYRFVLQNGTFSTSARVGGSINVSMNIQNVGYASPYNSRGLELILQNTSTGAVHRLKLNADPRRWLPGTHAVQQTLALPTSIPAGTYALLLNMPDPVASLYNNPAYSIQLANTNVWDASTGFNRLNTNLTITP